jgi:hypothetical protein
MREKTGKGLKELFEVRLKAHEYDPSNRKVGRLVCTETLNLDQIKHIFMHIKASVVLPVMYPISTFKNLEYFINFVLTHFVSVSVLQSLQIFNFLTQN